MGPSLRGMDAQRGTGLYAAVSQRSVGCAPLPLGWERDRGRKAYRERRCTSGVARAAGADQRYNLMITLTRGGQGDRYLGGMLLMVVADGQVQALQQLTQPRRRQRAQVLTVQRQGRQ